MAMYLGEDKVAGPGAFCDVSGSASKNLFDKATMVEFTNGYRLYTNGTFNSNSSFYGLKIPVQPNTTYTSSSNLTDTNLWSDLCFFDKGMNFISGVEGRANKTFTTPTNCYFVTYAIYNQYQWFQLEKGSTATEYEKYYEPTISVKDSNGDYHEVSYAIGKASKNLYDKKTVYIEGASNQNASNEIPVLPNTTYTFSIGKYTYGEVKEFDNSGVQINDIGGSESSKIITFTTSSNAKYITTLFFTGTYNNVSLNEIDFTQIQLELGSTATEYEEYYEPTLSIRTSNGTFREVKNEVETTTNITMADGYTLSGAAFEKKPILIKYGKVVQLAMLVVSENGFPDTLTGIGRLPEGYRPKYTQVFPCGLANAHLWYMDKVGYLNIGADGYINIRNSTGTQKYAFINVTFMTD